MNSKQKSLKEKPDWVSSFIDQDKYKLSQAELMQKKISLMSKHKIEAKDQWLNVQEKLKNNIIDDDTQKIYQTALHSKGLNNSTYKRKNLTQMIEWEKSERAHSSSQMKSDILEQAKALLEKDKDSKTNDPNFLDKIKQELEETKTFVTKAQRLKKPEKISEMNRQIQQQNQVQTKKLTSSDIPKKEKPSVNLKKQTTSLEQSTEENYGFAGLKNLDNVISFLENTLHSQEVQLSQQEENPFRNAGLIGTKTGYSDTNLKLNLFQKDEEISNFEQIMKTNNDIIQRNYENNKENECWKQNNQLEDISQNDQLKIMSSQQPGGYKEINQDRSLQNLNQSDIPKFEVPKYEQFKNEIMKIEEQQPSVNVQQKLNFDKFSTMMKNEISFDDNIDQLKQLLEQTRQELNQMNLQESSFNYQKQNDSIQQVFQEEVPIPRQFNYQMIYRKYKNSDTFNIHDHLA